MAKSLLIKSQASKTGDLGKWNPLDNAPEFIQGIYTGQLMDGITAEKLNSLISGIPTPWARAKLFRFAFNTIANPDPNLDPSGLIQFYNMLLEEWKGLMAVIALYPDRIRFSDPIVMDTRQDNYNSLTSAFGRMLFDDKDLWSNQEDLTLNRSAQPFIQLIYYRDKLVGGTSPMTACFTGIDYTGLNGYASDISWYRDGKFEDPTKYLTEEEVQKLYLFVKNFNVNLRGFEERVNSCRSRTQSKLSLNGLQSITFDWEKQLKERGLRGNFTLLEVGPVAQYPNLSAPYSLLFHCDTPVYLKPDYTFTFTNDGSYVKIGDIQDLLSSDSFLVGWYEAASEKCKLSDSPIHYLQVENINDGSTSYFSLPLSVQGLDVFKNTLPDLLDVNGGANMSLTGEINSANQLAVTLVIEIDGQSVTLNKKEYEIKWHTESSRVIVWPNFVSDNWNKYYLYSEFTSDVNKSFVPFFKYGGDFIRDDSGNILTTETDTSTYHTKPVNVKELVKYPVGQGANLKYDIISVDKPIAGLFVNVKDTGKICGAGLLVFRNDKIRNLTSTTIQLDATVGFDFGSNNTCVYYTAGGQGAKPIKFRNYRTVLIGKENKDLNAIAENNELLFFSNYEADNGQLKSWLHEHDVRYTTYTNGDEIAGGVPVNRPNIRVFEMDEFSITSQAGKLHYNMKWLNDDDGKKKKRSFLQSVWLEVCAFLYQESICPSHISWSYPGAMMPADINDLGSIFDSLRFIVPIAGRQIELGKPITEAEAVCSYAISNDFGLTNSNIFLGIDVGGSTSDILILGRDINKGNQISLFKESSVRLAAGVFFNAVIRSERFCRALHKFHQSRATNICVANIEEILEEKGRVKAPYYLNSIFDQLKTESDYTSFYRAMADDAKEVFTIPAYVTGLLLFYSGILIGKIIKEKNFDAISTVDILAFGKGGRLFHWLRNVTSPEATISYYKECLNHGLKKVLDKEKDIEIKYRYEIECDNKAEVAKGLCNHQNIDIEQNDNLSSICAEDGVRCIDSQGASRILSLTEELKGDFFDNDMNNFDFTNMTCFKDFFDIFSDFVSVKTRLCTIDDNLRQELEDLPNKVCNFITQDSEYKNAKHKANAESNFAYHQPLLIAEGACFLERSLIKKIFK